MIEPWRTGPTLIELIRQVQDEQVFLRRAAMALRRIAEQDSDIAVELQQLAQQIEAQAEDLARQRRRGAQ